MIAPPDLASAPLCVQVQLWLVEHLKSLASLRRGEVQVPVLGRREKSIQSDIDAAVAALGSAIYVFPLLPLAFNVNAPGPFLDRAEIRVRCIEDDTLNTTLPDCYELVEAVVRELHGLSLPDLIPISCLLPHPSRPVELIEDAGRIIHDVVFHVTGAYPPRLGES